jgi:hypothetical protein
MTATGHPALSCSFAERCFQFDSAGNTFGEAQAEFVDTWAQAYVNDRYAFSIGQVYCDPDDPKPAALNPDPAASTPCRTDLT